MPLPALWKPKQNKTSSSDKEQLTRDLIYTTWGLIPLLVAALVVVFSHVWSRAAITTGLLWALACLTFGIAIGFLFGIPKVLQKETAALGKPAEGSQDESSGETLPRSSEVYRQRVNTNLTEISDWLTKIIVGLGLVNLHKLPPEVSRLANMLAFGLNPAEHSREKAFAVGLIVCFSILGFLFGYLYTRLFLAGAFARADQGPGAEIRAILARQEVDAPGPSSSPRGGEPTEAQLVDAAKVEELVSANDVAMIRQQLVSLAREYERIRNVMSAGKGRTRKMEVLVAKMRTLALAGYPFLREFASSQSPGERLVAVVMLQIKPNIDFLDWLAKRFAEETPFITYHAAVALLKAVQTFGPSSREKLERTLKEAISMAGKKLEDAEIAEVLALAEKELFRTE
jgi:hypothetical protein